MTAVRYFGWGLVVALAFGLAASPCLAQADRLIVPGVSVGPINAATTEAALAQMLPIGQVKRELYGIGEGAAGCGTVVFAGTDDAVVIGWSDAGGEYELDNAADLKTCRARTEMGRPVEVWIEEAAIGWRTADGIGLGVTVPALAKVVSGPVAVSVCPCDFGGYVEMPAGAFGGMLSAWSDLPVNAEVIYGKFIDPNADYMLPASDIPPLAAIDFVLTRMIVGIK
jgi:hypothetical protein